MTFRRAGSLFLAFALITLAPGLDGYRAFADVYRNQPGGRAYRAQAAARNAKIAAAQRRLPGSSQQPRYQPAGLPVLDTFGPKQWWGGGWGPDAAASGAALQDSKSIKRGKDALEALKSGAAQIAQAQSSGQQGRQLGSIERIYIGWTPSPPATEGQSGPAPSNIAPRPTLSPKGGEGNAAPPAAAPPAPASPRGRAAKPEYSPAQIQRALDGLMAQKFISLIANSVTAIAFPLMLIELVGKQQSYDLGAIGGIASIALALLAGKLGDKMPLKTYTLFNTGLRVVISAATAGLYAAGWIGFPVLLGMSVLNAWQWAVLFNNDDAITAQLVGRDRNKLKATNALMQFPMVFVTIGGSLFLGPSLINALGYVGTYLAVAAVQVIPVVILWRTLPEMGRNAKKDAVTWIKGVWRVARKHAKPRWDLFYAHAALALAIGLYFVPAAYLASVGAAIGVPAVQWLAKSTIPIVLTAGIILLRSDAYRKTISSSPMAKLSLAFVAITAFIEIPLRNNALGVLAGELVANKAAAAALLGKMVAAFYFGQLPSITGALPKDSSWNVPGLGAVDKKKLFTRLGSAALGLWVQFVLLPVAWPWWGVFAVVPLTMVAYHYLDRFSTSVTDRNWLRFVAAALLFMSVPIFFWGQANVLYVTLAVLGFALAGSKRTVSAIWSQQTQEIGKDKFQYLNGVKNAFFNIATSIALAIYGVAKMIPEKLWGQHNAFPFTWYVIVAIYAAFAVLFVIGSRVFKEMPNKKRGESK